MSFGFTLTQAENTLMWWLFGFVSGVAVTIAVTVLATIAAVKINL